MDSESNLPPTASPAPMAAPPPLLNTAGSGTPRRRGSGWKIFLVILICLVVLAGVMILSFMAGLGESFKGLWKGPAATVRTSAPRLEESIIENNNSANKIAVIPVEGIITSDAFDRGNYNMVEYIRDQFKIAAEDARVKAVILKVETPGGEVIAADEISKAITDFQKEAKKPVVAAMGSVAASGGYYVSAPCRWVVANEMTITGSIGVIFHGLNYRGLMDKVGLRPEIYKSGKYKDMLSGHRTLEDVTPEEREMVQTLIDETFEKFKKVVSDGRDQAYGQNKSSKDTGKSLSRTWTQYADGRVLSGKQAYELGFVDELGNFETAVKRAQKLAGISNANLVEYQQIFDFSSLLRLFGKSEAHEIKVQVNLDSLKLKVGQLYFLSPLHAR